MTDLITTQKKKRVYVRSDARRAYERAYYAANRDKLRNKTANWNAQNKEKRIQIYTASVDKHRVEIAEKRHAKEAAHHKRREIMKDILGGKCVRCGISDFRVLQFDHIDPTEKSFDICRKFNKSDDEFLDEVEKCQLLCHCCHYIKTNHEDRDARSDDSLGNTERARKRAIQEAKQALGGKCTNDGCTVDDLRLLRFVYKDKDEMLSTRKYASTSIKALSDQVQQCRLMCANCAFLKTNNNNNK